MDTLVSTLCIAYFISFGIVLYGDFKGKKKVENFGLWGVGISLILMVIIGLIYLT